MPITSPHSAPEQTHLVGLLGESRGRIVDLLRREPRSVGELAGVMAMSEVAVRRHLSVLERDGLVTAETVRRLGPGRPCAQYHLTDRGRRLFPDQSAQFACELLAFLEEEHGRSAVLRFFQWRQNRHPGEGAGLAGLMGEEPPQEPSLIETANDTGVTDGHPR
jgi:predicted ArsR family transcriptional regulator